MTSQCELQLASGSKITYRSHEHSLLNKQVMVDITLRMQICLLFSVSLFLIHSNDHFTLEAIQLSCPSVCLFACSLDLCELCHRSRCILPQLSPQYVSISQSFVNLCKVYTTVAKITEPPSPFEQWSLSLPLSPIRFSTTRERSCARYKILFIQR